MIDLINKTDASTAIALKRRKIRMAMTQCSLGNSKVTCFDGSPGISAKAIEAENKRERERFRIHF